MEALLSKLDEKGLNSVSLGDLLVLMREARLGYEGDRADSGRRIGIGAKRQATCAHKASVGLGALKLRCAAYGRREVTWEVLVARPPRDARSY